MILSIIALASVLTATPDLRRFNIPAGPAAITLNDWSRQSSQQLLFNYNDVGSIPSNAVQGLFTPREALAKMMEGGPLRFYLINPITWAVVPVWREPVSIASASAPRKRSSLTVSHRPPCVCSTDDGIPLGPWCFEGDEIHYAPSCR